MALAQYQTLANQNLDYPPAPEGAITNESLGYYPQGQAGYLDPQRDQAAQSRDLSREAQKLAAGKVPEFHGGGIDNPRQRWLGAVLQLPPEVAAGILSTHRVNPQEIQQAMQMRQTVGAFQTLSEDTALKRAAAKADVARKLAESYGDPVEAARASGLVLPNAPYSPTRASNEATKSFRADSERRALEAKGYRMAKDAQGNAVMEAIPGGPAAGGRSLPIPLQTQLTEAAQLADATQRFKTTFQDEFGGYMFGAVGDAVNWAKRTFGDESGQAQWWQDYELHQSQIRNKLFGSALTAPEIAAWNKSAINPGMDQTQIRENLARRDKLEQNALGRLVKGTIAGRYSKDQVEAYTGRSLDDFAKSAPTGPVRVETSAQYDALPSGTEYVAPDGKVRRKK